jgi:hypothetical protein
MDALRQDDSEQARTEQRLLAAIAAALLGSQGSPAWSRTAESLLLAHSDVNWLYRKALDEVHAAFEAPLM